MLLAVQGFAADKPKPKPWQTLENCRYLDHKGNDGDSFALQCGSQKFILRLYFVDAPEPTNQYGERVHQQALHFGVSMDETLKAGKLAKDWVRNALGGPFLVLTKKATGRGASSEPRYLGLVNVGGRYLHEVLLLEGLAFVKGTSTALPDGEPSKTYLPKLGALEQQARTQRKGVWARSTR
jgi:endonuclease YncB( thermonuclease family)